jgi:uncharacterized protein YdaU (DUF1376 family)
VPAHERELRHFLFIMKDPAFLFYPSDFLTGTMFLNNEQIGIYIRLLCSQHQHGGLIDKLSFNSLVANNELLRSKFIETEHGFYNERLATEMDKRNKKSNNMSETAKEVWKQRKTQKLYKSNTNVKENDTNVKEIDTNVIHPININKDIIINKNINDIETYFKELSNSTNFENISKSLNIPKDKLTLKIADFKKTSKIDYLNFNEFCNHFKNWANKNNSSNLKLKTSFK